MMQILGWVLIGIGAFTVAYGLWDIYREICHGHALGRMNKGVQYLGSADICLHFRRNKRGYKIK